MAGDAVPTTLVVESAACTPNAATPASPSVLSVAAATAPARRRPGWGVGATGISVVPGVSVTVRESARPRSKGWDEPGRFL